MKHFSFLLWLCAISFCFSSCFPTEPEPEPWDGTDTTDTISPTEVQLSVLEYRPAMGQFVNLMPLYEDGDTYEVILNKAQEALREGTPITLGGFGGYVTLSLGQPITNHPNRYDFRVLGNAFIYNKVTMLGNSEPGIVMVSVDTNGNGLPDDRWYELAGSEYYQPETKHHYVKTWFKSDNSLFNPFHTQPYFPLWLTDTIIEVSGTLLASHSVTQGNVVVQQILDYGYADNKPNSDIEGTSFDLDWAVDTNGQPVQLDHCDFIRIQTAVDEHYPMIGELSTEVSGVIIVE